MPVLLKRFIRREVVFPRSLTVASNEIPDPTDNIFQSKPFKSGPHTILSQLGSTELRTTPKKIVAPTKSGTTGGVRGIRSKNIT